MLPWSDMNHVLRLEVSGVVLLAALLAVRMRQRVVSVWSLWRRPERGLLLLATVLVSARYLLALANGAATAMPGVGRVWLGLFAASCGMYTMVHAIRAFTYAEKQKGE